MPLSEKYAVLLFSVYQKRAAFTNPILLIFRTFINEAH